MRAQFIDVWLKVDRLKRKTSLKYRIAKRRHHRTVLERDRRQILARIETQTTNLCHGHRDKDRGQVPTSNKEGLFEVTDAAAGIEGSCLDSTRNNQKGWFCDFAVPNLEKSYGNRFLSQSETIVSVGH
jgi:hypothetical protein